MNPQLKIYMAYLRNGQILPSGEKSKSFVTGNCNSLVYANKGTSISFENLRELFKKSDDEIKSSLNQILQLKGEELEVVCTQLLKERDNGEWNKPFEFEYRRPTRK